MADRSRCVRARVAITPGWSVKIEFVSSMQGLKHVEQPCRRARSSAAETPAVYTTLGADGTAICDLKLLARFHHQSAWTRTRVGLQPGCTLGYAQVVVDLEVEPQLRRYPETLAEAQRGVGGNGALAVDDFADAVGRNDDLTGERVDAHAHRPHEVLGEDFAGRNQCQQFGSHAVT